MKNTLYAHTIPDKTEEEWQPLEEHLQAVAQRAHDFAQLFQSGDWAWNAGWLHDLGKATNAFQGYLRRSNDLDDSEYDSDGSTSNHASTGAALAVKRLQAPIGQTLAYLSAGHHAGLPDWYSADSGAAALQMRLREGEANLARLLADATDVEQNLRAVSKPPPLVKRDNFHIWVRMLFSCLVDADYLDTEAFIDRQKTQSRGGFQDIKELAITFSRWLDGKERNAEPTLVNKVRSQIRRACEAKAEKRPGLFSLAVPTGGGKTLSGMAFALRHAVKYGQRRVIYVIPYTSIIEQTAGILADIFGTGNVIEHHSNLDPEKETARSRLAAENWDAPLIVTTNVQFFESLHGAKSSRCRKLHNIVNSVVILDEAQLIPPKLLDPCVQVINELTRNYGVTVVLSTATQPALPGLDEPQPIIDKPLELYRELKRTEINVPVDLQTPTSWSQLAEEMKPCRQVLCIVNSRRDCYDLFRQMPEGTLHLSALMCGEHRSEVIAKIKKMLHDGEPCRVISTQLVEAGVDIDFPVVYRALAGLDSIAQAAGRCNREGKLDQRGQVHVFVPPKSAPPGILRKGEDRARELFSLQDFDAQAPASFTRYFELFYASVVDHGSCFKDLLQKDSPSVQFRTAASQFRIIDDQAQQPVFVRWGKSEKHLDELRRIGPKRDNMRHLQRFTVNLPRWTFNKAADRGFLEEIWPGFWCWAGGYDRVVGVDVFGAGWAAEDLVLG